MHGQRLLTVLTLIGALGGCAAPLVVGGAAGTAAVASDRRTTGTIIDDEGIELKVQDAINKDDELRNKIHINATSFDGIVLLTGESPNFELRNRIEGLTRKLPKVRRVYNEIAAGEPSSLGSRTRDVWITTRVKTSLLNAEDVSGLNIKVVTEARVVYLMGMTTRKEADRATALAREVDGVAKVVKLFEYSD